MPYLTLDRALLRSAWDTACQNPLAVTGPVLAAEQQLDYGRRAAVVHVPQSWPDGARCHNCHEVYPCRIALWGMTLLRARGWDYDSVVRLIEKVQAGEPL